MFRGIQKDQKHHVQQDKERVPSATVCCILYLVEISTLVPNIVSPALLCLSRCRVPSAKAIVPYFKLEG